MVIRPKSKLLAGFAIGLVAAVTTAAVAQAPAPSLPTPAPATVSAPAAVVVPVVPRAPVQNPGTLAAIEQSATTAPTQLVVQAGNPAQPGVLVQTAGPAPYVVPPPGPGIFEGSEQTMREIVYLQTEVAINGKRKDRIESVAALKEAEKDLTDQLAGKSKDDNAVGSAGPGGPMGTGPLPSGAQAIVVAPKPEPYVNSVYGYGNEMYAEIVLGSTKILATKGTILIDGSRVVSVSNSGVTLSNRGRSKKLAIRGSAAY